MSVRDFLGKWKPKEGTLPPAWAIWLTLIVLGCLGIPTSGEWSGSYRLWGDDSSPGVSTPVVSVTFSNAHWDQSEGNFALTADYTYDGPLPAIALLTAVDHDRYVTSFSVSIQGKSGTVHWAVTCEDIIRKMYVRPAAGTAMEIRFSAAISHALEPIIRPPTRMACVVP